MRSATPGGWGRAPRRPMAAVGGDEPGPGTCVGRIPSPPSAAPRPAAPSARLPLKPSARPARPARSRRVPTPRRLSGSRRRPPGSGAPAGGCGSGAAAGGRGRDAPAAGAVGLGGPFGTPGLFLLKRLSAPSFRSWGRGRPGAQPQGRRSRADAFVLLTSPLTPCSSISESRPRLVSFLGSLILPPRPAGSEDLGAAASVNLCPLQRRPAGRGAAALGLESRPGARFTCSRGATPAGVTRMWGEWRDSVRAGLSALVAELGGRRRWRLLRAARPPGSAGSNPGSGSASCALRAGPGLCPPPGDAGAAGGAARPGGSPALRRVWLDRGEREGHLEQVYFARAGFGAHGARGPRRVGGKAPALTRNWPSGLAGPQVFVLLYIYVYI